MLRYRSRVSSHSFVPHFNISMHDTAYSIEVVEREQLSIFDATLTEYEGAEIKMNVQISTIMVVKTNIGDLMNMLYQEQVLQVRLTMSDL